MTISSFQITSNEIATFSVWCVVSRYATHFSFRPYDLAEHELRKQELQEEINGYRGISGYNNDKILRLQLETALLKRDIIDIQITLLNTTNEEEKRYLNEGKRIKEQLLLSLVAPIGTFFNPRLIPWLLHGINFLSI